MESIRNYDGVRYKDYLKFPTRYTLRSWKCGHHLKEKSLTLAKPVSYNAVL